MSAETSAHNLHPKRQPLKLETKIKIGDATRKHGMTGTAIYRIWTGIITRCYNPNDATYRFYGGRGIKMCQRWRESFPAFVQDMGPKPAGKSIERVDNTGNYEPGNCIWATRSQQARNKRSNRLVTYAGKTMTLIEWSEALGIKYGTLHSRLARNNLPLTAIMDPRNLRPRH